MRCHEGRRCDWCGTEARIKRQALLDSLEERDLIEEIIALADNPDAFRVKVAAALERRKR